MRQNGFAALAIVVLVLVVLGAGGAVYYLAQVQNKESKPANSQTQVETSTIKNGQLLISPTPSVNQEQQKKFQSAQYKFSLTYPAIWSYKENEPFVPNLAEYTVTFSSPDGNSVLDVWIRNGAWTDVEKEMLMVKNTSQTTVAGQPAIIQSINKNAKVAFIKHPSLTGKVLIFSSSGENVESTDQIQQTLKFE